MCLITTHVMSLTSSNGGLYLRWVKQQLLGGWSYCDLLSSPAQNIYNFNV